MHTRKLRPLFVMVRVAILQTMWPSQLDLRFIGLAWRQEPPRHWVSDFMLAV